MVEYHALGRRMPQRDPEQLNLFRSAFTHLAQLGRVRVQHALPQRLHVADGAQHGSKRVGLELALGQREADERLDAAGRCYLLRAVCGRLAFHERILLR